MNISQLLAAACADYTQLKRDTTRFDTTRWQIERIAFTHALRCPACAPIADQVRQQRTAGQIADVAFKAADVIDINGFCRTYLWDTKQAATGVPLNRCAVDVYGAINIATHGTPRHVGGNPLTHAVEDAVLARIDAPSIAAWGCYPGNGKQQAVDLLRNTADAHRTEVAA